jgi:isoleucyl-tRNA synthetase
LISEMTTAMESYNLPKAMRPITEFINELSTWYLRRSRERFKSDDEADKHQALKTTKHVLTELAKLMAPFTPFMAETLWQKTTGHDFQDENQSVHLESWPESPAREPASFMKMIHIWMGTAVKENNQDNEMLNKMSLVRQIVELGLAKRDEAKIKIRQMLNKITVKTVEKLSAEYTELIAAELNVKTVEFKEATDKQLAVELDTVITAELRAEGIKREIIRFINLLRKEANLSLNDRAQVYITGADGGLKMLLENLKTAIKKDTLSEEIILAAEMPETIAVNEVKIDEVKLLIGLIK